MPPRSAWLRLWAWPYLALLAWLGFRWRMKSYALNVFPDFAPTRVFYMGTDPYYHLRAVLVSVANFPAGLRWDPWTYFPHGTRTGQFGTLFDQLLAGVILLLADGEPTRDFVMQSLAIYPAVLGALVVVPVFFVARRMYGDLGAAFAALVLALAGGTFFARSVAAHADHHVAESLMSALAVLGVLVSVERARAREAQLLRWREMPRRDLLAVAGWGVLGALAMFLYLWTWPPGVLFVAILGGAFTLLVALDHAAGRTSRGTAVGAGLPFVGAAFLTLPLLETTGFEVTFYTWTQPLTLLLAGGFVAALAWASEHVTAEARGGRPHLGGFRYLAAIVVGALVVLGALALASPDYFGVLKGGFQWVTGVGYGGGGRTIAEARPAGENLDEYLEFMVRDHGVPYWGALLGFGVLLWDVARRPGASNVVLLVWSAFMAVASANQVRFNYYFAVNVALLNGYLLASVARWVRLDEAVRNTRNPPAAPRGRRTAAAERLSWKHPVAVGAVLLLLVPGNVFVEAAPNSPCGDPAFAFAVDCPSDEAARDFWCRGAAETPNYELARCFGPDREIQFWTDGLDWLRTHTADPGFKLGDNPDPETFQYPPQAYGVISWWDYGHWTQVLGERAPVANPFQQAAKLASRYFTATSEADGDAVLREWSPDRPIRYVLIDDASATTKYYAITVWAGVSDRYANEQRPYETPEGQVLNVPVPGEHYESTMMARLYRDDARSLERYRLVHEERMTSLVGSIVDANSGRVLRFQDILDWGSPARMDAAYGLGYKSQGLVCEGTGEGCPSGRYGYDLEVHSSLKFFERVEGAVLVGEAEPGERVTAVLELRTGTGRVFSVEREAVAGPDGRWSVRVAYPTTDFLAPAAGGTDADVVPEGPWLVAVGGERTAPREVLAFDVPEVAVLQGLEVEATP